MTQHRISTTVAMLVSISALMESAQANLAWVPIEKRAEPAEESKAQESKAEPKASEHTTVKKPEETHHEASKSATEPKETAKPKASESHKNSSSSTTKKASPSHSSEPKDKKKEASASDSSAKPSNHFSFNGVSPSGPSQQPASSPTDTQFVDQGNQNGQQSSGVSGGAVAGIIVAVLVGVAAIVGFLLVRRRKKEAERNRLRMKPDPFTMGFGNQDPPAGGAAGFSQATTDYPPHTAYNMANQSPMIQLPPIGASAPQPQPSPVVPPPVVMTSNPAINQYNAEVNQYHNSGNAITSMPSPEHVTPPTPLSAAPGYDTATPDGVVAGGAVAGGAVVGGAIAGAAVAASNNSPQTTATEANTDNSDESTKSIGVFPVVSTYTPTLSDELDIQPGDRVEVLNEYDDGWCQGINLSRGNCKGVFPKHCVDMFTDTSSPQPSVTVTGSDQPNYVDASGMKRVSSMLGHKQQQSSPYYL